MQVKYRADRNGRKYELRNFFFENKRIFTTQVKMTLIVLAFRIWTYERKKKLKRRDSETF